MKKSLVKFFAGVTAAASLLLASCTTQNDYLDETTARNAFNVTGIYLTGFDAYNLQDATLHILTDSGEKTFTAKIADVNSDSVPYFSGTGYLKLDTPYLYDGDALAQKYYKAHKDDKDADGKSTYVPYTASAVEMYLTIGDTSFMVWNNDYTALENASLSVPTSPAGTEDDALVSRWITVQYGGSKAAKFDYANSVTEPKKVNLTTVELKNFRNSTVAEIDGLNGVSLTSTESKTAYPKFIIEVSGIDSRDIGNKYVLVGANLASEEGKEPIGAWDPTGKTDSGLIATVNEGEDNKGTVKFEFYGKHNGQTTWGKGYEKDNSPVFRIILQNDEGQWGNKFLIDTENTSDDNNLAFPKDIDETKDYTLKINLAEYDSSLHTFKLAEQESAGAGEVSKFTVNKIIVDKALADVELIGDFDGWNGGRVLGEVVGSTTEFDISSEDFSSFTKGFKIRSRGTWDGSFNIGMSVGGNILPSIPGSVLGSFNLVLNYSEAGITKISFTVAE